MSLALQVTDPRLLAAQADHDLLLARLRAREQAALEELAVQFSNSLTRAAYVYLCDADAAQDATQDALIAAWDGARRTSEQTHLRPWLFGVLFNSCRKQVRTLARRRKRDRGAARGEAFTPANDNSAVEEQERLRAALAELPEDQRQIVVLRFEQQFSVEETASALGIPQGTVKSRLHAALAKLRTLMGARHE